MRLFCTKCGKELQEGLKFCIHCGAEVTNAPRHEQPQAKVQTPQHDEVPARAVSMWTYFGLDFLYSIPLIGLIASLITVCTTRDESLKVYAKAKLAWQAVGLAVLIVTILVVALLSNYLLEYINSWAWDHFDNWGELFDWMAKQDWWPF